MWLCHVKMATQNLLKLLLLLRLMMRNVSTTVWCRFGRWTLVIKLSFCSDFEDKVSRFVQDFEVDVQARFWSWSLVIILLLMLGCGYEVHSWSRFWFGLVKIFKFKFCRNGDVWLRFWSWCKVEILKMFDQDLYLNLCYDPKKLIWLVKLNPRVRCAFGNVYHDGCGVQRPCKWARIHVLLPSRVNRLSIYENVRFVPCPTRLAGET